MKKFLLIPAVIASLFFGQVANAVVSLPINLSDVDESTYYFTAIDFLKGNGVIHGYPNGEFKPDQCVNRVEFLKMLYLAANEDVSANPDVENIFSDASTDEWYWPFLAHGVGEGDVEGYEDGTFRPGECVNRMEAVKLAVLAFNNGRVPDHQSVFGNPFDVASMSNRSKTWWWDYYVYAFSSNIIGLTHFERYDADWSSMNVDSDFANPTFDFGPTQPMTRKEVAELLYRTKAITDNEGDSYALGFLPWSVNFYRSVTSGVSFSLTDGWMIKGDYYYKSGTFMANFPTIVMENIKTGEEVIINERFMQCTGVDAATCYDLAEGFMIGAENPSSEAIKLMDKVLLTFKVPETFIEGISVFQNTGYDYSFEYPASLVVNSNDYDTPATESYIVWVPNVDLNIEIQDPEIFTEDTGYGSHISLPLRGFAEYIREENIRIENPNYPDKEIGELKEATVAGFDAYQFDLTYSFETERGGYVLYDKYEYFVLNNGNFHVVIWIPTESEAAWAILDSLEFE